MSKDIIEELAKASKIVSILCTEGRGFRMPVPANEDTDEDLIVAWALSAARKEIIFLRQQLKQQHGRKLSPF